MSPVPERLIATAGYMKMKQPRSYGYLYCISAACGTVGAIARRLFSYAFSTAEWILEKQRGFQDTYKDYLKTGQFAYRFHSILPVCKGTTR